MQRLQVPAKRLRVLMEFLGIGLKAHDDARLIEADRAVIDELDTKQCLARAGDSFNERGIIADDAAEQYLIESANAGRHKLNHVGLRTALLNGYIIERPCGSRSRKDRERSGSPRVGRPASSRQGLGLPTP